MIEDSLVDELISMGILRENKDGFIQRTEDFESQCDEILEERLPMNQLDQDLDDDRIISLIDDRELLSEYLALKQLYNISTDDRIKVLHILDNFRKERPYDGLVPDGFLPIYGSRLDLFTHLHDKSIVFIWDENPKSELVKDDFNTIDDLSLKNISLFSVYWPNWRSVLRDQYSVNGAPTTLFFLNNTVDVRLVGAQYLSVLNNEVSKLSKY